MTAAERRDLRRWGAIAFKMQVVGGGDKQVKNEKRASSMPYIVTSRIKPALWIFTLAFQCTQALIPIFVSNFQGQGLN